MKISKNIAEHYNWGDRSDGWHLVKNQDLSIIHERMPANTSEVKHYHQKARQFFFVLSGTATMEMDDKMLLINKHEGIEVAPHIWHQLSNQSNEDIEFLVISQPNSSGDRVVATGAIKSEYAMIDRNREEGCEEDGFIFLSGSGDASGKAAGRPDAAGDA